MLTDRQHHQMYEDGYVVLPGLLPRADVDLALQAINHDLGSQGIDPEQLPSFRAGSYCPELSTSRTLLDLFDRTDLAVACTDLVGPGQLLPARRFQCALRFPAAPGRPAKPPRGHLDGLGTGINGIPKGSYTRSFTGLCVVLLSDLPEPDMGNFTVWPGSHRQAEAFFKGHGHTGLASGGPDLGDLGPGVQITGRAGDVVLTHHLIIHGAANNVSPHIRYAIITRFTHRDCASFAEGAFTDMWREWEGLRRHVTVPGWAEQST